MIVMVGEQRGLLLPGDHLRQWGMGTADFGQGGTGEESDIPVLLSGAPRTWTRRSINSLIECSSVTCQETVEACSGVTTGLYRLCILLLQFLPFWDF